MAEQGPVDDFWEVVGSQRAMRRFNPDPVPDELGRKVIWAATRAPNGGNVQPWRFLVITDLEKKRGLRDIYLAEWRKYAAARQAAPQPPADEETARSMARSVERATNLAEHMDEVPVLIMPCGFLLDVNTGIASGSSIYPAIQN